MLYKLAAYITHTHISSTINGITLPNTVHSRHKRGKNHHIVFNPLQRSKSVYMIKTTHIRPHMPNITRFAANMCVKNSAPKPHTIVTLRLAFDEWVGNVIRESIVVYFCMCVQCAHFSARGCTWKLKSDDNQKDNI